MNTVQDILARCKAVDGKIQIPSEEIDRKLYVKFKKHMEVHGFEWKGGKTKAFVPTDNISAQDALDHAINEPDEDLKQKYQFFPTPESMVVDLLYFAELWPDTILSNDETIRILEPSAGRGAILEGIVDKLSDVVDRLTSKGASLVELYVCELWDVNRKYLEKNFPYVKIIGEDFLQLGPEYDNFFDFVIANPPFTGNQDIIHCSKMHEVVKVTGRVASITSTAWLRNTDKKSTAFRNYIDEVARTSGYNRYQNAFIESGTPIETLILYFEKESIHVYENHVKAIGDLLWKCGVLDINATAVYEKLVALEKRYHDFNIGYANLKISMEMRDSYDKELQSEVQKLFNNNLKGLETMGDPRGSCIQINSAVLRSEYSDVHIHRNFGGNGVLGVELWKSNKILE